MDRPPVRVLNEIWVEYRPGPYARIVIEGDVDELNAYRDAIAKVARERGLIR